MPVETRIIFLSSPEKIIIPQPLKRITLYIERLLSHELYQVLRNNIVAAKKHYQDLEIISYIEDKETEEMIETILKELSWEKIAKMQGKYYLPENPSTEIIIIIKKETYPDGAVFEPYIIFVEPGWRD